MRARQHTCKSQVTTALSFSASILPHQKENVHLKRARHTYSHIHLLRSGTVHTQTNMHERGQAAGAAGAAAKLIRETSVQDTNKRGNTTEMRPSLSSPSPSPSSSSSSLSPFRRTPITTLTRVTETEEQELRISNFDPTLPDFLESFTVSKIAPLESLVDSALEIIADAAWESFLASRGDRPIALLETAYSNIIELMAMLWDEMVHGDWRDTMVGAGTEENPDPAAMGVLGNCHAMLMLMHRLERVREKLAAMTAALGVAKQRAAAEEGRGDLSEGDVKQERT